MKVHRFSVRLRGNVTRFSADFCFSKPYGTLRQQRVFRLQKMVYQLLTFWNKKREPFSLRKRIWFTVPTAVASVDTFLDAFFFLAVGMAVYVQEDLEFQAPVSHEVASKIPKLLQYFASMKGKLPIHIRYRQRRTTPKRRHSAQAQFFTLGVDSFYTLLCHKTPPTSHGRALLYVEGYDVPLQQKTFLRTLRKKIESVASETENTAVFIQTNLREVSDSVVGWGQLHVAALAAVGNLLIFKTVLISGESFNASDWGLQSGADALFSTKHLEFQLVGHETSRYDKISRLHSSPQVQLFTESVRVCWQNVMLANLPYNCSVCQKCVKTQLVCLALNMGDMPTFLPIDLSKFEEIWLPEHVREEWKHLARSLQRNPAVPVCILQAVHTVIEKHEKL